MRPVTPACFHPSKEGFKGLCGRRGLQGCLVSIPLRKVSRVGEDIKVAGTTLSFHPSKEGFKVAMASNTSPNTLSFHPSKEGFKAGLTGDFWPCQYVSIPLRKVSREVRSQPFGVIAALFPSL